jgi:hypothetical protein
MLDMDVILETLICKPARELQTPPTRPVCIVLDALDECDESNTLVLALQRVWAHNSTLVPHPASS